MPVIEILLNDHRELIKYMDDIEAAIGNLPFNDTRKHINELFNKFVRLFSVHHLAEDMILYNAIKHSPYLNIRVLKSYEAHKMVAEGLAQLELFVNKNEIWKAKFMVIRELILMHIREEENELFPVASEILSQSEKNALAKKIQEQRTLLTVTFH